MNILVTGTHRSGSTWIGKTLCASGELAYVDEPFHATKYKRLGSPIDHWYEAISPENDADSIREYVNLFCKPGMFNGYTLTNPVRLAFAIRNRLRHQNNSRFLFKDPLALLSARWLSDKFHTKNVFIVRHPCAFALSLKKKNWTFDFDNIKQQEGYFNQLPADLKERVNKLPEAGATDIMTQAALIWSICHFQIYKYKSENSPDDIFVRHEDFLESPVEMYESLYKFCSLNFNDRAKKAIEESTTAVNPTNLERDARKEYKKWKQKLTESEIAKIRSSTEKYWTPFYSETDW